MFVISSYSTAIIFCVITMICWGSWANTQKLSSSKWRFELFYWDYTIGILLLSVLMAFTFGSYGTVGRPFLVDLNQAQIEYLSSAFIGGVLFNLANILLVAAISLAGMAVAFPVGIGIALILGVILNYFVNPQGNPILLFSGVVLIAIAILLNAYAYWQINKNANSVSKKGIFLSIIAGVLMGFFYKYVAASMITNFNSPEIGKLTPYTALFIFASGVLVSNFLFNRLLMYFPITGNRLSGKEYFEGSLKDHLIGIVGGVIWHLGMTFNIIAATKAGPAISYGLGQGATIVAAIWGIFIWKEFKNAPKGTTMILNVMLLCYIVGLGLIIAAR